MLRLIVTRTLDGYVIIDNVATEELVNMIAARFRHPRFTVRILYP